MHSGDWNHFESRVDQILCIFVCGENLRDAVEHCPQRLLFGKLESVILMPFFVQHLDNCPMIIDSWGVDLNAVAFVTMLNLNFPLLDQFLRCHPRFLFRNNNGRYLPSLDGDLLGLEWNWNGGQGLLLRLHVAIYVIDGINFCHCSRYLRMIGFLGFFFLLLVVE